jgi:hypothetical protein
VLTPFSAVSLGCWGTALMMNKQGYTCRPFLVKTPSDFFSDFFVKAWLFRTCFRKQTIPRSYITKLALFETLIQIRNYLLFSVQSDNGASSKIVSPARLMFDFMLPAKVYTCVAVHAEVAGLWWNDPTCGHGRK